MVSKIVPPLVGSSAPALPATVPDTIQVAGKADRNEVQPSTHVGAAPLLTLHLRRRASPLAHMRPSACRQPNVIQRPGRLPPPLGRPCDRISQLRSAGKESRSSNLLNIRGPRDPAHGGWLLHTGLAVVRPQPQLPATSCLTPTRGPKIVLGSESSWRRLRTTGGAVRWSQGMRAMSCANI
ncbi:hypothetical protein NDU88_001908 [Pleurodeles waltl]|uniref:Uncharacterized protein n=1 Tax=Pleurodeles waltl TaxID=8319 RepID=A0AAV7VZ14_PLEWA|nr:hypothetical protein NDU88_001908 [Pleurodeles waltl]